MKIEIWHVVNTEKEADLYYKEQSERPFSQRPDYSYIQRGEIEVPFKISEME